MIGAIEMGGTKIICAVYDDDRNEVENYRFATGMPDDAVKQMVDFYKDKDIKALAIGSFGPVGVNPKSDRYGKVLDTPKAGWRNYDLIGNLKKYLDVPMVLDTDVNCACMGEMIYGCGKGCDSAIYITIGTGIGVGVVLSGNTLKGMLHPEGGHILIRHRADDTFEGNCPYHKDCFEGLCAGPALEKRYGTPAINLVDREDVWEMEADYIAQAVVNYILTYSPEKIILGGGVMEQEQLFPLIRSKIPQYMEGYISTNQMKDLDNYVVPAALGGKQALLGAYYMALNI